MTHEQPRAARVEQALRGSVHVAGGYRPFAELTAADAHAQAAELNEVGSWGPMRRIVPVARAWEELAALLDERQAARVADLDGASVVAYAERLWVLAPEEGLI